MKTFVNINSALKKQEGLQYLAKNDYDALYILFCHHNFNHAELGEPMLHEYYTQWGEYNPVNNLIMN